MSHHQRPTNERALARHRFKRSRDVLGIRAIEEITVSAPDVSFPSNPVPTTDVVSLYPPIGTGKLPQTSLSSSRFVLTATTMSLQTTSASSSSSSLSSTPSSVFPSSSSSTSVRVTSSPSSMPTASHTFPSEPSSQTDAANSGSLSKSQSLSPGAVGGIVAVIGILAMIMFGFLARRRAQRRRAIKRNTWGAGLVPALENKRATVYAGQPFVDQSMAPNSGVPAPEHLDHDPGAPGMVQYLPPPSIPGLDPPASSFNPDSLVSPIVPTSFRGAPSLRSVAPSIQSVSYETSELAIVARTFIPSLPDELHIANAEQIRILNKYDDGWALCSNSRGDQGFVPLECLQRSTSIQAEMQLQPQSEFGGSESNGTSKRLSSLASNTAGTY